MTSTAVLRRIAGPLSVVWLACAAAAAPASAAPIVSIVPANQTVTTGSPVVADIVVSGLTEGIGGFAFTVGFNTAVLSSVSYVVDPDQRLGDPMNTLDFSAGFSGGTLDVFYVADAGLDGVALAALQGAGFVLARATFTATANGGSALDLGNVALSDALGGDVAGVTAVDGSACVGAQPCVANPVPEPTALLLGSVGLLALLRRRGHS